MIYLDILQLQLDIEHLYQKKKNQPLIIHKLNFFKDGESN